MKPTRIYPGRQPKRPHYIREWAEKYGYEDQADLVEALQADKSVVSRWYSGASPGSDWQLKLAHLFGHPDEPDLIFRHPDYDWMTRFLRGRSNDEIRRIQATLESAFPPKNAQKQ